MIKSDWKQYSKLIELDSFNNKILYFKQEPEEMYLVSTAGQLLLTDVFNPKIVQDDWVAREENMPVAEKQRVLNRFKTEILGKIVEMARRDGIVDSVLFCISARAIMQTVIYIAEVCKWINSLRWQDSIRE